MSDTKVSIIMPVYNKERFLKKSINSVLQQKLEEFELIIVNDGSKDGSKKIIHQFDDERIIYIEQANMGVSAARNTGIKKARGDLVAFIDADDEWYDYHLTHLIQMSDMFPTAMLFANDYIELRGVKLKPKHYNKTIAYEVIDDYLRASLSKRTHVWTSSLGIRKHKLEEIGGFPLGYNNGEDLTTWMLVGLYNPIVISNYVGAIYRQTQNGLSGQLLSEPDIYMITIDKLLLSDRNLSAQSRETLLETKYKISIAHAISNLLGGAKDNTNLFLDIAAPTVMFKKRWLLVKCISFLFPRSLIQVTHIIYKFLR